MAATMIEHAIRVRSIQGQPCVRVRERADKPLLLDFGRLLPPDERGYQAPETRLVIDCPWRLDSRERVVVGYFDRESVELRLNACVAKRVEAIQVFEPAFTLWVRFEGGLALWVFPDDARVLTGPPSTDVGPWMVVGRAFAGA